MVFSFGSYSSAVRGRKFDGSLAFLAVGALAGSFIWMRSNRVHHFGVFHLVALFAVLAALASASASGTPLTASLKAGSLFLLFYMLRPADGLRWLGENSFVRGLVLACEILVFITVILTFAGHDPFGNPNNLGAFVGIIASPMLLWAALVAESRSERQRHYTALALCVVLLYVSVCRAAIVADAVVTIALTMGLRRPQLLLKTAFVAAFFLEALAVADPSHMGELVAL